MPYYHGDLNFGERTPTAPMAYHDTGCTEYIKFVNGKAVINTLSVENNHLTWSEAFDILGDSSEESLEILMKSRIFEGVVNKLVYGHIDIVPDEETGAINIFSRYTRKRISCDALQFFALYTRYVDVAHLDLSMMCLHRSPLPNDVLASNLRLLFRSEISSKMRYAKCDCAEMCKLLADQIAVIATCKDFAHRCPRFEASQMVLDQCCSSVTDNDLFSSLSLVYALSDEMIAFDPSFLTGI